MILKDLVQHAYFHSLYIIWIIVHIDLDYLSLLSQQIHYRNVKFNLNLNEIGLI
nr:MAG TPA: hypothetical protein [Caudoviricetes sp.]